MCQASRCMTTHRRAVESSSWDKETRSRQTQHFTAHAHSVRRREVNQRYPRSARQHKGQLRAWCIGDRTRVVAICMVVSDSAESTCTCRPVSILRVGLDASTPSPTMRAFLQRRKIFATRSRSLQTTTRTLSSGEMSSSVRRSCNVMSSRLSTFLAAERSTLRNPALNTADTLSPSHPAPDITCASMQSTERSRLPTASGDYPVPKKPKSLSRPPRGPATNQRSWR